MALIRRLLCICATLLVFCSVVEAGQTPRYLLRTSPQKVDGSKFLKVLPSRLSPSAPTRVGSTAGAPGSTMGFTFWDYQHNGTLGRQIDSYDGRIQTAWTRGIDDSLPYREIRWSRADIAGSAVSQPLDDGSSVRTFPLTVPLATQVSNFEDYRPGFANLRGLPDGRGVVAYHDLPYTGSGPMLVHQLDYTQGHGLFVRFGMSQPAGAEYQEDGVLWPKLATEMCGGDSVVHTVATWSGDAGELWYWRGTVAGGAITYDPPVMLDSEAYVTAAIETFNGEVAVCYIRAHNEVNWDVMMISSTDCGLTWGSQQNLTNYPADGPEGAYTELAMAYDASGVLHILWNTVPANREASPTRMYHWSPVTGIRTVTVADWVNLCNYGNDGTGFNNGAGNANVAIADVALTIKPAGFGPGGGIPDELIYALWTQFKSDSTDCASRDEVGTPGGYVNGELMWSASSNGGLTWDRPQSFTGTHTPNCLPGDCASEAWVTTAARADSAVFVSYVADLHAGAAPLGEGVWTENEYRVVALETRLPVVEPLIGVSPRAYYEQNVKTFTTVNLQLEISNLGTADLSFNVAVAVDDGGSSHVLVNGSSSYTSTINAGFPPEIITVTLDGFGLPDPSAYHWRLEVTSNDPANDPNAGGAPIDVAIEAFVADSWQACEADTLSTGQHRLQVSSCLELGDQSFTGGGFYSYSDSTEWLYTASPVITRDGIAQPLAFRNVFMTPADRTRDLNQSFKAVEGPMTVTRTSGWDKATGTAATTDSSVRLDYEITTFKYPGLTHGALLSFSMYADAPSPLPHLSWGALADFDVSGDGCTLYENIGIGNLDKGYIGVRAATVDTAGSVAGFCESYAAVFNFDPGATCDRPGWSAVVLDNNPYAYGQEQPFPTDSLIALMRYFGSIPAYSWYTYNPGLQDTASDLSVMMVNRYDQTLAPFVPVEWGFGIATSDVSQVDLEETIEAIRAAANPACAYDSCADQHVGDVTANGSITAADWIYLLAYVCQGGPPPGVRASGDVNGDCVIDSSDVAYLMAFVHSGGPAPVSCTCVDPAYGGCSLCVNSVADSCLVACPAGDIPFYAYIREADGTPIVGYSEVWLDFSSCPGVVPCPGQADWPLVYPAGPSDASGRVTFFVKAGMCDEGCQVPIKMACGTIGYAQFKSVDVDGDLRVRIDDNDGSACTNFNCDGKLDLGDLALFSPHVGHACTIDPCLLLSSSITLNPDTMLSAGDPVEIVVDILNANPTACLLDSVIFLESSFDLDTHQVRFASVPLSQSLAAGESYRLGQVYTIPPSGAGCIYTRVYSSCCDTGSVAEYCISAVRLPCPADTAFSFAYWVTQVPVYYRPTISGMPFGFSVNTNPSGGWILTADTVTARISIDTVAAIGDSASVIMYFCRDAMCDSIVGYREFRVYYQQQRGDVNGDCTITSADIIYLVNYVFKSGPSPLPTAAAGDVNCVGGVSSADIIYLVNYVFKGGDPPLGDCP